MAASINQIVNMLYAQQGQVSKQLGSYIPSMTKEQRVMIKIIDATFAVMHQALVAHGVYTDAELSQRIQAAAAGAFEPETDIIAPVPPDPIVPTDPPVTP